MKKNVLVYSTLGLVLGFLPAPSFADEVNTVQTTTTTQGEAQVVDSYMKPVYSKTTETVDADGNKEKSTAPMIMERHEKVLIPGSETRVTTVETERAEHVQPAASAGRAQTVGKARRPVYHRLLSHKPRHRYVATRSTAAPKVSQSRQTIVNEQRIIQEPALIDRKDPALEQN